MRAVFHRIEFPLKLEKGHEGHMHAKLYANNFCVLRAQLIKVNLEFEV